MRTEQMRAAKGGEIGANGEWYEGGKFIATTERKKTEGSKPRGTGKEEIAPYKWEVAPEGMRSLYAKMGKAFVRVNGDVMTIIDLMPETIAAYAIDVNLLASSVQMWNDGQRWVEFSSKVR